MDWLRIGRKEPATEPNRPRTWLGVGTTRENSKIYFFTAATRALRRDLYREPVFLWITPFFTALSIMETVVPKASWACFWSPVASVSRSLRSAVRRRDVLARLSWVRLVVW